MAAESPGIPRNPRGIPCKRARNPRGIPWLGGLATALLPPGIPSYLRGRPKKNSHNTQHTADAPHPPWLGGVAKASAAVLGSHAGGYGHAGQNPHHLTASMF